MDRVNIDIKQIYSAPEVLARAESIAENISPEFD